MNTNSISPAHANKQPHVERASTAKRRHSNPVFVLCGEGQRGKERGEERRERGEGRGGYKGRVRYRWNCYVVQRKFRSRKQIVYQPSESLTKEKGAEKASHWGNGD